MPADTGARSEAGLAFYRDRLGHELIWRTETSAGLRMPGTNAEIVVQTERREMGSNLTVASADEAVAAISRAGGRVVVQPFDIPIGRCAVVEDPWGNRLVLLDNSKGLLVTGADGRVLVDAEGKPRVTSAEGSAAEAQDLPDPGLHIPIVDRGQRAQLQEKPRRRVRVLDCDQASRQA